MKQKILIGLILLGCSSFLCAENTDDNNSIKVDSYTDEAIYLEQIPPRLQKIKEKERKLKLLSKQHSEVMNMCATLKLDALAEQACKEFEDNGDRLKEELQEVKSEEYVEIQKPDIIEIKHPIKKLQEIKEVLSLEP